MDVLEIVKLSPPVLYLLGVIYLFKENQDLRDKCEKEKDALIERYHVLVGEQVHTLQTLAEKLEEK